MKFVNRLSIHLRIPYTLVLVCILIIPPVLIGVTVHAFQTGGITPETVFQNENMIQRTISGLSLNSRLVFIAGATLISIIAGVLLSRNLTGALAKIIHAAEQIGAGDYSRRITSHGPSEVKKLAVAFNTMAEKLEVNEITRTELQQTLEELAITDELTGVYNRRELNRLLDLEFRRAKRFNRPLSMILYDIDHFKLVNDTHGHLIGDQVLSTLTNLIVNNTRSTNFIARFGGDEFVILLPETTGENAQHAAERLRKLISQTPFEVQAPSETPLQIQITISLGVAELNGAITSPEDFFLTADQALYKSKHSGRNQTQIAAGTAQYVKI